MLSPDERTLLVDILAPPRPGFQLVHAVGTTFTLDLTALLPIPLGLAGSDLSPESDPLALLHAVRSYASKIDVFCQAGHISVPLQRNDLVTFLEPMVHQVKAPPGGLFHPKFWILRFSSPDDEEEEVYRFAASSRNLTHDRAWDALINLEGRRTRQRKALNRPLADFLHSLASRVPNGVPPSRRAAIRDLAEGLRFVEWERPDGTADVNDWIRFHVLGQGHDGPDLSGYRRLLIAPFIDDGGLRELWPNAAGECTVISRGEELDRLKGESRTQLDERAQLHVVDDGASIPALESAEVGRRWSLSGLHAKLYVIESHKRAYIFIGSANATDAAFRRNDELLVEIVARTSVFGIDKILGPTGLGRLLLGHTLGEPTEETPEESLRRSLENALRDLASLSFTTTVEQSNAGTALQVTSREPVRRSSALPSDVKLVAEPLTLSGQQHMVEFGVPLQHRWQLDTVEEVTPFLVLRLTSGTGSSRVEASSVVMTRLMGDPPDRLDRVLARRIGSPKEFLRFILLLLKFAGHDGHDWGDGTGAGAWFGEHADAALEAVLEGLARGPQTIDEIDRLIRGMAKSDHARAVLPAGWLPFWLNVMAARRALVTR